MALHFLKRRLPSRHQVVNHKSLRFMAHLFADHDLWHFNRHSVARGAAIGIFCAFLPMPFEMVPAAIGAIMWRANLPLAIAAVWISNPLTWIPLWGPPYLLGAWLLQQPAMDLGHLSLKVFSMQYVALWLGCLIVGTVVAVLVYFCVHGLWRLRVASLWRRRNGRRT